MAFFTLLIPLVVASAIYIGVRSALGLYRNIQLAKKSKLPYIIVPAFAHNFLIQLLGIPLLDVLDRVIGPPASAASWRWMIRRSWAWTLRHAPFSELGTDTFLTVSPGGCVLYTADADVIHQITSRRQDFPKPTEHYQVINIFGSNVVTTEGADWKRHRKLIGPAFAESTNKAVWEESLKQTRPVLDSWILTTAKEGVVRTTLADAMSLTLSVLGKVSFGLDMSRTPDAKQAVSIKNESARFREALGYLLGHLLPIVLVPHWLLKRAPLVSFRKAYRAFVDVQTFTSKVLAERKAQLENQDQYPNNDLIWRLIGGSTEEKPLDYDDPVQKGERLSDSEVLGNTFIFLFAGHDTTAGTIASLMMFLALHPDWQRKVQEALDSVLEGTDMEDYNTLVPKIWNNPCIMAVVNETLRLVGPAPMVPKNVPSNYPPQSLMVNGHETLVQPGTIIKLSTAGVQRNPKYWVHRSLDAAASHWTSWPPYNPQNDLEAFSPGRWIQTTETDAGPVETFITPPQGAFVPFSDGPRSCIGKRFAMMELLAVLTAFFSTHSVELAVDDFFPGENLATCSPERKAQTWSVAASKTNENWRRNMAPVITLQLRNSHVPMRFVKRGEEMFT